MLYLNQNNKSYSFNEVLSGTEAEPECVFQAALKAHASSLIVAHNHPSGNIEPSNQDLAITKKLKQAGQLLDLQLLDHIILLPVGYVSLADEGHL